MKKTNDNDLNNNNNDYNDNYYNNIYQINITITSAYHFPLCHNSYYKSPISFMLSFMLILFML